jgi:hypothetical protein
VAFSETFGVKEGAEKPFWTMLPPKLLRQGRNDIRIYLVKGDPSDPYLEPITLE